MGAVVARHGYTRLVQRARSGECDANEDWPKRGPLYSEYSRANGEEVTLSPALLIRGEPGRERQREVRERLWDRVIGYARERVRVMIAR